MADKIDTEQAMALASTIHPLVYVAALGVQDLLALAGAGSGFFLHEIYAFAVQEPQPGQAVRSGGAEIRDIAEEVLRVRLKMRETLQYQARHVLPWPHISIEPEIGGADFIAEMKRRFK